MEANYICPNCRTYLNVGEQIILFAKRKNGNHGILLLTIHVGDYEIQKHKLFDIEEKEIISLFCPCCHKSLKDSNVRENSYKIIIQDNEDQEYEILFSGIYGGKCTYQVSEYDVKTFG